MTTVTDLRYIRADISDASYLASSAQKYIESYLLTNEKESLNMAISFLKTALKHSETAAVIIDYHIKRQLPEEDFDAK